MRPPAQATEVDVYLWFEGAKGLMKGAVINQADPERMRRACALLDFD